MSAPNPQAILHRLQSLLDIATRAAASGRALDIAMSMLHASIPNEGENQNVVIPRLVLDNMMTELNIVNTNLKVFTEYYIKQSEQMKTVVANPNASVEQAQEITRQRMAPAAPSTVTQIQNAAPKTEYLGIQDTATTPKLELPAAPTMPAPAQLERPETIETIMRIAGGLEPIEREHLMQEKHMVPNSPHAQLEFPSTSPVARYFYNEDGIYQHRDDFPRVHIDPNEYEVKDWLGMFAEGAYGKRNAVDAFDTPTAIVVRMDDDGIALMWNPVNNTYRIFYMDQQLDANEPCGFRHRWISHKNFTPSMLKNVVTSLKRRLGFAA